MALPPLAGCGPDITGVDEGDMVLIDGWIAQQQRGRGEGGGEWNEAQGEYADSERTQHVGVSLRQQRYVSKIRQRKG